MGSYESGSNLKKASQVVKHLTDRKLKSLRTELETADVWDGGLPGFGVRVRASGKKSFWIMYRTPAGRKKRYTLKKGQAKTLAQARDTARKLFVQIADGKDPGQDRADYRVAETVNQLCDDYLRFHAQPHKKATSVQKDVYAINRDVRPGIGDLRCRDVQRKHIIRVLDSIQHGRLKPVQARRTRALLHKIFSFGVERGVIDLNPCAGLPKLKKESGRDRVLSLDEIEVLFAGLKEAPDQVLSNLLLLVLITGQRPGEVSGMRRAEVDVDVWTIPGERAKNGRVHRVFLHPWALEILEQQRTINAEMKSLSRKDSDRLSHFDEFVFNTRYGGGFAFPFKSTRALVEKVGIPPWRAHDLRRTCATHLENGGFSSDCIDRIQNHAKGGMAEVYQRGDRWAETSKALQWWGDLLRGVWDGRREKKVLPFARG